MTFEEAFNLFYSAIISIGGTGVIILALSSWFGKIWASMLMDSLKRDYQKEIDNYRNQLEILKTTTLRYSDEQFKLYNKLWHSLCTLKYTADSLWEGATNSNLRNFSEQLNKSLDEVDKSYLFIEEEHYKELTKLLNEFKNYEIGKRKLFQLYLRRNSSEVSINPSEIQMAVKHNMERKQKYEQLIKGIGDDLKKQIRGNN